MVQCNILGIIPWPTHQDMPVIYDALPHAPVIPWDSVLHYHHMYIYKWNAKAVAWMMKNGRLWDSKRQWSQVLSRKALKQVSPINLSLNAVLWSDKICK